MIGAAELAARHRLRRVAGRSEWRGDCPACHYAAGLVVRERDGRTVWWCASCADDRNALTAAVIGRYARAELRDATRHQPKNDAERSRHALTLWHHGVPVTGTLAARYLAARGVLDALGSFPAHPAGPALRFLPRCRCTETGGDIPAMLAGVRDPLSGELRAVHRTFLDRSGRSKAPLAAPKKSLSPISGAAVLLHAPCNGLPLVIAEGTETALGASALLRAPAWAAVSAGNIPALRLPSGVRDVVIAADPGDAGEGAAEAAARRWRAEGRRVRIALPDDPGADFCDLLLRRAASEARHAG